MEVRYSKGAEASAEDIRGRVLTHDLGPDLRKGTVLEERHLARIREQKEVHLMQLYPGDVHEDAAALHIGHALAGDGVEVTGPVQSQVRLLAARRGLLRVAAAAVDEANHVPWVSVFTVVDGQAVEKGDEVAGAKVIPVAVPAGISKLICRAETYARGASRDTPRLSCTLNFIPPSEVGQSGDAALSVCVLRPEPNADAIDSGDNCAIPLAADTAAGAYASR